MHVKTGERLYIEKAVTYREHEVDGHTAQVCEVRMLGVNFLEGAKGEPAGHSAAGLRHQQAAVPAAAAPAWS